MNYVSTPIDQGAMALVPDSDPKPEAGPFVRGLNRADRRARAYKGTERRTVITKEGRGRILRYARSFTGWIMGARRITLLQYEVLRTMLKEYANPITGQLDVSHAKLAILARCSIDTVQRALCRFEELGVLSWVNRWHRVPDNTGKKLVHRTSNGYTFTIPDALPQPVKAGPPSNSHKPQEQRGTPKRKISSVLTILNLPKDSTFDSTLDHRIAQAKATKERNALRA